jgi:hypothetical protein
VNHINAAAEYKAVVAKCVKVSENLIAARLRVQVLLDSFNSDVESIREAIFQLSQVSGDCQFMASELKELISAGQVLNESIISSQLTTIGCLGSIFDELRCASNRFMAISVPDLKEITPILERCHKDLDSVCLNLIKHSIVDASFLRSMGFDI